MFLSRSVFQKINGTVKFFLTRKGYGIITASDPAVGDVFVHQTDIVSSGGFRALAADQLVSFEIKNDDQGRKKACNVTRPDGTPCVPPPPRPFAGRPSGQFDPRGSQSFGSRDRRPSPGRKSRDDSDDV